jgi:hypothetical protein
MLMRDHPKKTPDPLAAVTIGGGQYQSTMIVPRRIAAIAFHVCGRRTLVR